MKGPGLKELVKKGEVTPDVEGRIERWLTNRKSS
jgi:hypothetical protein